MAASIPPASPSQRSTSPSIPPAAPSSGTPTPVESPSSQSATQRAVEGAKRHSLVLATFGGGTLISGITFAADLLERANKISSAIGMQMTALFVAALVLMAVYLARRERNEVDAREWQQARDAEQRERQDRRDAEARAERERTRNAYQAMIEAQAQRHHDDTQDAHAALKGDVARIENKVDTLVGRFDEAAKAGAVLKFGGGSRV